MLKIVFKNNTGDLYKGSFFTKRDKYTNNLIKFTPYEKQAY